MHLWENRLRGADRDRAPKLWRGENGQFHMAVGGVDYDVPGLDSDLSEGRPGMWDRDARLADMDAEGIDTSLIFHARAMALTRMEDKEFFTRCMDVYNEWLTEYCAAAPERLVGVGILPTIYHPEATRDYIQKLQGWGLKALEIPSAPKNIPYNASKMAPMWAAIEGKRHTDHVPHRRLSRIPRRRRHRRQPDKEPGPVSSALVAAGLQRHIGAPSRPENRVLRRRFRLGALDPAGCGRVYQTYGTELKPKLAHLPSYYFRRQCYSAIIKDDVGLKLAKEYGMVDNLLWSCDYPHGESIFGNTRKEIRNIFDTLGPEDARKVVGGTAAKLWNL